MNQRTNSVRMGPISIFAIVIILCLSVMAVLTTATAHANYSEAEKQANYTTGLYANEVAAQEMTAGVDAVLAQGKASNLSKAQVLENIKNLLPNETTITNDTVYLSFVAADGRRLTVGLSINNDYTYEIVQWKTSTNWNPTITGDNLWTGM